MFEAELNTETSHEMVPLVLYTGTVLKFAEQVIDQYGFYRQLEDGIPCNLTEGAWTALVMTLNRAERFMGKIGLTIIEEQFVYES